MFAGFLQQNRDDADLLDLWLRQFGTRFDEVSGRWVIPPPANHKINGKWPNGFPLSDWPQQETGNNPFWMQAARLGFVNIVRRFIMHYKCNLKAKTKSDETALHLAAYFGHADVCRLLVDLGADREQQNTRGETALVSARTGQQDYENGRFPYPLAGNGFRCDQVFFRDRDTNWPRWDDTIDALM
jgi:hypothetical protein